MTEPVVRYCLFYDYVENVVERRGPYRADHLALVGDWKAAGKVLNGGALGQPPSGALIVFAVDGPEEVETFVSEDPYVQNGIVTEHRVVPWTVVA